ncbi:MAG: hypothetical protein NVS3B10_02930 [Polyangiales bacterium]
MTQPFYARWAGRVLGADLDEPPPVGEREREAAIGAIERAIRERGRHKARARWAIRLGVAVAAVVVVGVGANAYRGRAERETSGTGTVTGTGIMEAAAALGENEAAPLTITGSATGLGATISSSAGAAAPLTKDAPVATGHRIVARGKSRASLAFSTGTQLTVENGGDLLVVEEGRSSVFSLSAGEIRARVAKLGAGDRFVVRTPDAEVEVRGTSFGVAIAPAAEACGNGTVTRVTVDEGAVVVRRGGSETRVARGEEWPSGCDGLVSAGGSAGASARASAEARAGADARAGASSGARASAGVSSLVEQNNLFAEALAFKNSGQHAAAVGAFERFVARYPSSNLAENAAVERMKLLLADDHERGVAAARQYLRRYPNGFAQSDAKAAIAGGP